MVLKELCLMRGLPGHETPVRDFILEHVRKYATSVEVDRMGNILAFKKGTEENAKHIMFSGHMDEVGMLVLGINENGLLSYTTVGGIDPRVMVSKPVLVGPDAVPGVIGAKAIHLQSRDEMSRVLGHDQLYIDIGARDKAAAEKLVKPGDPITFDSQWVEFGNGLVKTKALDDRVGCMTMMSLLENDYPCDITCAFTVQEETGLRGARCAAYNVKADAAIVLEGTSANDLGCVDEHLQVCRVGKGIVISFMDTASIGHKGLFNALRNAANKEGVNWQLKQFISGGNDAGALQTAYGALPTAVLSVPCRYIHSPSSVAAFADIEAQFLLADAFLKTGGAF